MEATHGHDATEAGPAATCDDGSGLVCRAERVGFEPTDHLAVINALAGRPIRPLWHLSGTQGVYRASTVSLACGTVAEWTIAPALKAGGRKARGFESLPFR
jgi:hypothetical protein